MEKEKKEQSQGTCSAVKGCCKCKDPENSDPETEEERAFEKTIDKLINQPEKSSEALISTSSKRRKRQTEDMSEEEKPFNFTEYNTVDVTKFKIPAVNVSSTKIILAGLKHFSEYRIQILSCQDENATENWCSKSSRQKVLRTKPIRKSYFCRN